MKITNPFIIRMVERYLENLIFKKVGINVTILIDSVEIAESSDNEMVIIKTGESAFGVKKEDIKKLMNK